jgi:hypothetical protein
VIILKGLKKATTLQFIFLEISPKSSGRDAIINYRQGPAFLLQHLFAQGKRPRCVQTDHFILASRILGSVILCSSVHG